jgi:hypothetical protein
LIRACLAAAARGDQDDPEGATEAITAMTFFAGIDEQWVMILELVALAPEDEQVLGFIAAGPLEGFLGRFDNEAIERVEAAAEADPKFRRVLTGVWKHGMSDAVWKRVRAVQATVPDPLSEMRPLNEER